MPTMFNVTLKDGASVGELNEAKETAKSRGGTIKHEYKTIQGFTVEFPTGAVRTLETNDHIDVEQDGGVKTQ